MVSLTRQVSWTLPVPLLPWLAFCCKGRYGKDGFVNAMPGANLPLATLGTFILWLGWFDFNGGSQLKISDVENANAVARIFVNTNAGVTGGVIAALIVARLLFGKADLTWL